MAFKWNSPKTWTGGKSADSAAPAEKEVKPKVSAVERSLATATRQEGQAVKALGAAVKAIEGARKRANSLRAQIAEQKSGALNKDLDKAFLEAERIIKEALAKNGIDAAGSAGLENIVTLSKEQRAGLETSARDLRGEANKASSDGADLDRLLASLKAA